MNVPAIMKNKKVPFFALLKIRTQSNVLGAGIQEYFNFIPAISQTAFISNLLIGVEQIKYTWRIEPFEMTKK